MKKIALFGGSFNPIHKGHINLALSQNSIEHFDKIILIPSNIPPHKSNVNFANNFDRINMCKLAVNNNNIFEVSDIEYVLSGTSYTINTLLEIKKLYKDDMLYLIIGSDMLYTFNTWYRYKDILEIATILTSARTENEDYKLKLAAEKISQYGKIKVNSIDVLDISSSRIRDIIKEIYYRKDLDFSVLDKYLEKSVIDYIIQNDIYKYL